VPEVGNKNDETFALLPSVFDGSAEGGRVHDAVVRTVGGWILGGRFEPGAILPREEDLVASLNVSRTSLR